jgi:pyrroloquinoline-quinone synthase
MTVQKIIEVCQSIIHEKRYAKHPFVTKLRENPTSKKALKAWAVQKYHQVYLQNQIFSAIHCQTSHEEVRQFMMEQLIAEETPINCGSDTHYNLMRRFAEACGAEAADFEESAVSKQVKNYVNELVSICRCEHFTLGLLAIYAIEHQSGESVGKLLNWLRDTHDFSEEELEWFTVHSEAEDEHADKGLMFILKYADSVPDFKTQALNIVTNICDAWLVLHDYYLSLLDTHKDKKLDKEPILL